jgi:hypothetical protein
MLYSEPKYPWDPPGCEACCSGEPAPTFETASVSTVAL